MAGAFDAILEESDRLSRLVVVEQRLDVGLQLRCLGLGDRTAPSGLLCRPVNSSRKWLRSASPMSTDADGRPGSRISRTRPYW
ncbi:MAG: hypothetical protein ACRDRR_22740 [Pseudonocardiaceae bacterium]